MQRSLVGSEMCIRDRHRRNHEPCTPRVGNPTARSPGRHARREATSASVPPRARVAHAHTRVRGSPKMYTRSGGGCAPPPHSNEIQLENHQYFRGYRGVRRGTTANMSHSCICRFFDIPGATEGFGHGHRNEGKKMFSRNLHCSSRITHMSAMVGIMSCGN